MNRQVKKVNVLIAAAKAIAEAASNKNSDNNKNRNGCVDNHATKLY